MGTLLLYLFRGIHQADMRELFYKLGVDDFDFLSWRRHLHRNGALLRDGKIWVYDKCLGNPAQNASLDLSRKDLTLLSAGAAYPPLIRRVKFLSRTEGRPSMTPKELDAYIVEVLTSEDFLVYTRKFIRKKMSFLRTSYGVSYADLENDLKIWGNYSLLRSYPRFDDVGHGIAIAKTTVKRRGVNLIKTLTAKRQNQLITRSDGSCEKTTVSLSNIEDTTGQFLTADGTFIHKSLLVTGLDGLSSAASGVSWETLHSLNSMLSGRKLRDRQKEFLSLMLGRHSDKFSEFLGEDNEVFVERTGYDRYMDHVCAFMGLQQETARAFLSNLKPLLGGKMD